MTLTIRTNNVPRLVIDGYQLTPKERKDFDYIDWPAFDQGNSSATTFFRYKKCLYDLGEFMLCPSSFQWEGWDGYHGDTFFSGIVIKYLSDDHIVVGQYFS